MDDLKISISPKRKALSINLDGNIYGTFAEIGAGQEVVRHFFRAGGASGTIAKAMSAYDKDFSDAIYGKEDTGQYVCKSRLQKMIEHEYGLMEERLKRDEHPEKKFFAYANTMATVNFDKSIRGHGWMGIRYQSAPDRKPNDIIIHVQLHDIDAAQQQEAIGILGLNLVYSCFNYYKEPKEALMSLYDNLSRDRVEIDMISLRGPDFEHIDNRLLSLQLVKFGMTDAVMFGPDGNSLHPSEVLYKKNILTIRGRFRPVTKVHMDMLENGYKDFIQEKGVDPDKVVRLFEITLNNLTAQEGDIDEQDFFDRAELLCSLGQTVLISNYSQYYKLLEYFSTYTKEQLGLIIGVKNLEEVFKEKYYTSLNGGILEAFGVMFTRNTNVYLYPFLQKEGSPVLNSKNVGIARHLKPLLQYFVHTGRIKDITEFDPQALPIFSDDAIEMIKKGEKGWEKMVPGEVDALIKEKKLFGFTP